MINLKKAAKLKLELLSNGVGVNSQPTNVGTKSKEEYRALFDARLQDSLGPKLPPEIVLEGDITAKTVYRPSSHLMLIEEPSGLKILNKKTNSIVSDVRFPPRPEFYNYQTSSGVSMKKVGQVLGLDTLGIIVNSYCCRFENNEGCKVCTINKTTGAEQENIRNILDLEETVKKAWNEKAFDLINLTGGTFKDLEKEFNTYNLFALKIREIMGMERLPGITSYNPPSEEILLKNAQGLKNANYDMLTFNLEAWNKDVLKELFPGKSALGGRDHYINIAKKASEIIGQGHLGIILMSGSWEGVDSILDGCKAIASEGILPIPVVFHSGGIMEYTGKEHTSVKDLTKLYQGIYDIYQNNNLMVSGRKRPAGSEKSFRNSLINESYLGLLN